MEWGLDLLEVGPDFRVVKTGPQIGAIHAIAALHLAGLLQVLMPGHQGSAKG